MTRPYIMADDLSGALEAGAAFGARGWRVVLNLGDAPCAGPEAGTVTLRSTETRNARGAAAAEPVRRLLAAQQAAGAQLLFKKIDSTLRGPVAAEIKVLLEELKPPLVVVCPASPAVGRTVLEGMLHVHGVPVTESEYRNDPIWPVREGRVAAMLGEEGVEGVVRLSLARLRSVSPLPADCSRGVLVSDAETEADLSRLVELVRQREPGAVFVGAGGLARALAADTAGCSRTEPVGPIVPRTTLFVSGSMSAKSRRQLDFLREHHAVPLHEASLVLDDARATADRAAHSLVEQGRAALAIASGSAKCDPREPVGRLVSVVKLMAEAGTVPELLAATGGETAQAVAVSLGIGQLRIIAELEPGVVLTCVVGHGQANPKWVVIKPGGFGSDEVWANIFNLQRLNL